MVGSRIRSHPADVGAPASRADVLRDSRSPAHLPLEAIVLCVALDVATRPAPALLSLRCRRVLHAARAQTALLAGRRGQLRRGRCLGLASALRAVDCAARGAPALLSLRRRSLRAEANPPRDARAALRTRRADLQRRSARGCAARSAPALLSLRRGVAAPSADDLPGEAPAALLARRTRPECLLRCSGRSARVDRSERALCARGVEGAPELHATARLHARDVSRGAGVGREHTVKCYAAEQPVDDRKAKRLRAHVTGLPASSASIARVRYQRAFLRSSSAWPFLPARLTYLTVFPRQNPRRHASMTLIAS